MNAKFAKVISTWIENIGVGNDTELADNVRLDEIGADSLDCVELEISIEEEYNISFKLNDYCSETKPIGSITLGEISEIIKRKTSEK